MIDTSSLSPIRSRFEQLSQSEEGLRQSDRRCLALSHSARTVLQSARSAASTFLKEWINASLISEEDWSALPEPTQRKLVECPNIDDLLSELIELDLLTEYQAARLILGKTWGLILGSYRVLDRIGAGGMGVVFQAEHLYLRHTVAVKVLSQSIDQDFQLIQRFFTEMRAVALLRHPNIVAAMDGGVMRSSDSGQPDLYYFVMEHIPGEDLEEVVARQGPLEMTDACQIAHQVAMALSEVHKRQLVHRDIKPSNIRITPTNQIKLVDFGLVRHFSRQLTDVGSILGTLDYLAPEQAEDSRGVDIRADIYGLGGTLFWCLTGQTPFPSVGHPTQELLARLNQPPPSLLSYNPNLPPALDKLVKRMMASDREDRFSTPEALAQALSPFLEPTSTVSLPEEDLAQLPLEPKADLSPSTGRVLLVDDSGVSRHYYSHLLKKNTFHCKAVASGEEAIQVCREYKPSVVLADWVMSGMTGLELCQRLRKDPPTPNLKLILFSAQASDDDLAKTLTDVVDDYVIKNSRPLPLIPRLKAAVRLKQAQDRADQISQMLLASKADLEKDLFKRDRDHKEICEAMVLGMAKLVEHRNTETGAHLLRLQRYCRCLATKAAELPNFSEQITPELIDALECCVPLHDIGTVALPDHLLLKPGRLDSDERLHMQHHTIVGAETLRSMSDHCHSASPFFQVALDIVRHHHEHYDGTGYPDGLSRDQIPLSARIVTICDRYDAIRSRRAYRPGLPHSTAIQVIQEAAGAQLDPHLVQAFLQCAHDFQQIYREYPDGTPW